MSEQDRQSNFQVDGVGTPRYFGRSLTSLRRSEVGHRFDLFAERLGYSSIFKYTQQESGRISVPSRALFITSLNQSGILSAKSDDLMLAAGYLPERYLDEDASLSKLPLSVFIGGMSELTNRTVGLKDYAVIAFAVLKDAVLRRRA